MKKETKLLSLSSVSSAVLVAAFFSVPQNALACGEGAYTGEVCLTAASYCPKDTLEASGAMLDISQHEVLFSLLGCAYGGNCRTSFALPDLRGRASVHYGQAPGLDRYLVGERYGHEQIVQAESQMAKHTHTATFTPSGGSGGGTASGTITLPVTGSAKIATSASAAGSVTPSDHAVLGKAEHGLDGAKIYRPAGTSADLNIGPDGAVTGTATGPVTLAVTGGSGSGGSVIVGDAGASRTMVVVGPRLAMRYCIVSKGLYPPRS